MTKVDGRKGSRSELYELRKQAVQLHEQRVPVMQIVERTGLSWPTVNSAIKRYQEEGEFALMPLARGRKNGTGRMLTAEQESEIRGYIRKKRPKFYGLKKSLWDRGSVQQLIAEKYGAELSERLIGNYLRRWDLTPKQYKRHGYDNCSPDIRRWLDSNYAEILRQARDDGAEIYWLIAPKMVNIGLWRPDAPPGAQLCTSIPEKKSVSRLTMIAASNNQGKLCWALCNGVANSSLQIKFFEALIHDNPRKKLVLIRANVTSYNSVDLMAWIRENSPSVKVIPESIKGKSTIQLGSITPS